HLAILPEQAVAGHVTAGKPHDLTRRVDSQCLTRLIAGQPAEVLHAGGARPDARPEAVAGKVPIGGIGEPDDDRAIGIDRHRRIPVLAVKVTQVDHLIAIPHERVPCALPADRHIAVSRNADYLTAVVVGRRGGRRIAGVGTQLALRGVVRAPNGRTRLEYLRRVARRVMHGRLGPAHHVTACVHARRESIFSAPGRQGVHGAPVVGEAETDLPRGAHEGGTTPRLTERVGRRGLRDSSDHAVGRDAGPLRQTDQPGLPEILDTVAVPEGRVTQSVRAHRIPGDPAAVIDAGALCGAREDGKLVDAVAGRRDVPPGGGGGRGAKRRRGEGLLIRAAEGSERGQGQQSSAHEDAPERGRTTERRTISPPQRHCLPDWDAESGTDGPLIAEKWPLVSGMTWLASLSSCLRTSRSASMLHPHPAARFVHVCIRGVRVTKASWVLPVLLFSFTTAALGQTRVISGRVTASVTGEPLPGVTVAVVGTQSLALTQTDGRFSIGAPPGDVHLLFRKIGYQHRDVPVTAVQDSVTVTMELDVFVLDAVVVNGQATSVERRNATTGNTVVMGTDIGTQPAQTVDKALQGKVPGAIISQNSGAPGGGVQVQLRGVNTVLGNPDPLYVVDGVIYSNISIPSGLSTATGSGSNRGSGQLQDDPVNRLADLNPNDIESIQVLPGAAASAIYGSKAANGVIIVKT